MFLCWLSIQTYLWLRWWWRQSEPAAWQGDLVRTRKLQRRLQTQATLRRRDAGDLHPAVAVALLARQRLGRPLLPCLRSLEVMYELHGRFTQEQTRMAQLLAMRLCMAAVMALGVRIYASGSWRAALGVADQFDAAALMLSSLCNLLGVYLLNVGLGRCWFFRQQKLTAEALAWWALRLGVAGKNAMARALSGEAQLAQRCGTPWEERHAQLMDRGAEEHFERQRLRLERFAELLPLWELTCIGLPTTLAVIGILTRP